MSQRDCGLILFIFCVAANAAGLLFAWWLSASGHATITQWVRRFPAAGVPVLFVQALATFAICLHFYGRK